MSMATYWAARQQPARPLDKLVLIAFADHADKATAECFPSVAALCQWTGCDRKTVMKSMASLEAARLIIDTGQRRGRTRQVKVYRLPLETVPEAAPVPETGQLNGTVFPTKESQKRDTEPPKEPTSKKTTSSQKKNVREPVPFVLPNWVPADAWRGWLDMRRTKGGKDTTYALNLAVEQLRKLADAGHPPGDVLDQSTLSRWTKLYALKDTQNEQSRSTGRSQTNRSAVGDAYIAAHNRVDFG